MTNVMTNVQKKAKREKNLMGIYPAPSAHWVGDAFNVRSMFTYNNHGRHLNPFLLLDRAGPTDFEPTDHIRGVGGHPHRGFETVTLVYEGEVAHHDSTGEGGVIGPGDVQWMTAASGILHEEYLSEAFSKKGGMLDMVQLWVNLPAKDKMSDPGYQHITGNTIPAVTMKDSSGSTIGEMRVIAGEYPALNNDGSTSKVQGPAKTFTALDVWDFKLKANAEASIPVVDGRTVGLIVLHGEIDLNAGSQLQEAELAIFEKAGNEITFKTTKESVVLLLSGEAIEEPIFGHGPFVMNTRDEIKQASLDFMQGKFGVL